MEMLRECIGLVINAFDSICSISIIPGITVGGIMVGVASFVVVLRLIVLPFFQAGSDGKGK